MRSWDMRSLVSPAFRKMLDKLPQRVQDEARSGFAKWKALFPLRVGLDPNPLNGL